MLKLCGKPVSTLGKHVGKTTGQSSTDLRNAGVLSPTLCEQLAPTHSFTRYFPPTSSTGIYRLLHLATRYFYPISTAPTNTPTKGK